ncbi:MAG: hypothetical protein MRERC_12c023 [Mycoplasmataceae bacterium RC_NB112A]|nr:MAG: hypothetical protein MRERC_12c023 [Mycoplasmataceae bacterium RC_NB112A]
MFVGKEINKISENIFSSNLKKW